ncbi:MAG: DUF4330 domain-containing protein [Defluviitaleaceae bacterium]|nr:DUF4330 domain-containing protein [Defluviitaleaceae bacterium]
MLKKFNALDVLICAAIIAIVFASAAFLSGGGLIMASNQATVYFTIEAQNMPEGFHEKITVGDTIEDSAKGFYYGIAYRVEVVPAMIETLDAENQRMVRAIAPERETILLTVKCEGTESDTAITARGQTVKIGQRMTLKGKGYALGGFIVELRTEQ